MEMQEVNLAFASSSKDSGSTTRAVRMQNSFAHLFMPLHRIFMGYREGNFSALPVRQCSVVCHPSQEERHQITNPEGVVCLFVCYWRNSIKERRFGIHTMRNPMPSVTVLPLASTFCVPTNISIQSSTQWPEGASSTR